MTNLPVPSITLAEADSLSNFVLPTEAISPSADEDGHVRLWPRGAGIDDGDVGNGEVAGLGERCRRERQYYK